MLHSDTKNPSSTNSNTLSKTLLAFKPRQVLLAQHNPTTTMTASALKNENSSKSTSLTPELKTNLHQSILNYLHRNGFSRTLKRFQSEAQVQSDTWKTASLHLEDIFCKYNDCNVGSNKNTSKKQGNDETIKKDDVCVTNGETSQTTKKKKKKGTVGIDNGDIEDQLEVADKKTVESGKRCSQRSEDVLVSEIETKSKKKRIKHDFDSSAQAEEAKSDASIKPVDVLTKKTKDKKTKDIQQDKSGPSTGNEIELVTENEQKEKKKKKKKSSTDSSVHDNQVNSVKTDTDNETIQLDVSRKEEKSSKKRKRPLADENENENQAMKKTIVEESKGQKTKTSEEGKREKEGTKVNEINALEMSDEQLDRQANGKLDINGVENPDAQKSTKKRRKDSAEPKTVNAFQRVKIDQVEFAHEKLQDNSYWAKDGADIGYGAKAQEVLGQVRGRDFRHEKTKKKRGSYRGGLIDLQSHSVKFNYSDED